MCKVGRGAVVAADTISACQKITFERSHAYAAGSYEIYIFFVLDVAHRDM